ncbi:phage tail family protein [Actinomadura fulvescens]|uniref:Siphovirus-type tail component C-terminal domain-containing protein n=1 Tax=Actinomadura fulvescens TaxID=46160 RepID=A0ABN3Q8N4_9ACTN
MPDLITSPGQLQWRHLLVGDGTGYAVSSLTGWRDMPDVDVGTVSRPNRHGAWPGQALAQARTVTVEFTLAPFDPAGTGVLVEQLVANTALRDDAVEEVVAVADYAAVPLVAFGQLTRRSLPQNIGYGIGGAEVALQWVCADPRLYSATELTARIPPASSGSGGLIYPLDYENGLDYGQPGELGQATIPNAGNAHAHPVLTITGPADDPQIINLSTGVALGFDLALAVGETLDITTSTGAVRLNADADRLYTMTAASAPVEAFTLAPGDNTIALRGTFGGAADLLVSWRHAYL